MCGYCCAGVPVDKRGEAHAGCSAVCYNTPGAARVARAIAEAVSEERERIAQAISRTPTPLGTDHFQFGYQRAIAAAIVATRCER